MGPLDGKGGGVELVVAETSHYVGHQTAEIRWRKYTARPSLGANAIRCCALCVQHFWADRFGISLRCASTAKRRWLIKRVAAVGVYSMCAAIFLWPQRVYVILYNV